MNRNTLLGVPAALICVVAALLIDHDSFLVLLNPSAIILVLGGTSALALAIGTFEEAKALPKVITKALTASPDDMTATVERLVEMASTAQKSGLLSLEDVAKSDPDLFFRRGVGLLVNGKDADTIRDLLDADIAAMAARHQHRAHILKQAGGFAPTLGIIGTVIGLVHVMSDISSPATLGPAIAAAFTATLWGVLSANIFWLPLASKLTRLGSAEIEAREAQKEGLLAIQEGERPRGVMARLASFVPQPAAAAAEIGAREVGAA